MTTFHVATLCLCPLSDLSKVHVVCHGATIFKKWASSLVPVATICPCPMSNFKNALVACQYDFKVPILLLKAHDACCI